MTKVVLVGTGNTGTVLGHKIQAAGHEVVRVISRSAENASILGKKLGCSYGVLDDRDYGNADLYIICLADYAMNSIGAYEPLRNKFIVHTAGSLPIKTLAPISDRYGVLYPLQSLSKFVERIPELPLMVDGNNDETTLTIENFAKTLSDNVARAGDRQRMSYHIAAVFAANFANHMYALAEIYCRRENIDFSKLQPIIEEIHHRIKDYSPFLTQTGPAIRNDVFTITKHMTGMNEHEDLKYMYLKLTENILKMHGKR